MARTSWFLAVLAFVAQDDQRLEALRKADLERIRSRVDLTHLEQARYTSAGDLAAWDSGEKAEKIRVRIVPLSFRDVKIAGKLTWVDTLRKYLSRNSGGRLKAEIEQVDPILLNCDRSDLLVMAKNSRKESQLVFRILEISGVYAPGIDAYVFAYAGERVRNDTCVLWPHQWSVHSKDLEIPYTIAPEKGSDAAAIHSHEFLHLFGLPDKDPCRHCILAFGYELLDVCGFCRARLGWAKVGNVEPADEAVRISLGDLAETGEVVRIPASRWSESLFLELRGGKLMIWHRLKEDGRFLTEIDGKTRDRVTPYSEPAFRGRSRGSRPVYITDIWIDPDGKRAFFTVGTKAELTPLEQHNLTQKGRSLGRPKEK
jgi:hypothetical protein